MDDLISRQAAIDAIGRDPMGGLNYEFILRGMPTAEPKTGRWIPQDWNETIGGTCRTLVYCLPKCSICGYSAIHTNYCPNCGARMEGEDNEAD